MELSQLMKELNQQDARRLPNGEAGIVLKLDDVGGQLDEQMLDTVEVSADSD